MKKITGAVAAVALAAGVIALAAPAQAATPAAAKKYTNCTALNAKYPGGVAKSKSVKNTKVARGKKVAAQSSKTPTVNKSLYAKNKGLDRDKDGIACER